MGFKRVMFTAVAAVLLAMPAAAFADPQSGQNHDRIATSADTPARQSAVAWFMRPALVGRTILQGKYIIEHDTDRQARGEPCTHIYAANNRRVPVATFYCRHLARPAARRGTVTVYSTADPAGFTRLDEFQFAGEAAAHGVPAR